MAGSSSGTQRIDHNLAKFIHISAMRAVYSTHSKYGQTSALHKLATQLAIFDAGDFHALNWSMIHNTCAHIQRIGSHRTELTILVVCVVCKWRWSSVKNAPAADACGTFHRKKYRIELRCSFIFNRKLVIIT